MQTSDRVDGRGGWFGRGSVRPGRLLLRLGLSAVACVVIAGSAASCSLIVSTSSDQCAAVDDCKSFPGLRSCTQNVCMAPTTTPACTMDADCSMYAAASCVTGLCVKTACSADGDCSAISGSTCVSGKCSVPGCTKSAECASKGAYFVCRKAQCVKLTNDLCTTVHTTKKNDSDAYLDDNAVFFGSILPTVGPDADFGLLIEDAAKMAIDDFAAVNGIPSTTAGTNRPLVLVGCNDGPNEDQTDKAAQHLAEELDIPAIIGYPFSGSTISVATDVTIKDKVLLFSSSATSDSITTLNDSDLVWRTSPPDTLQASALSQYYPQVETSARVRYPMIPANQMKVAIINHSDSYGSNLGDKLEAKLTFNGKSAASQQGTFYKRFNYGMSGTPDLAIVGQAVTFAPDVIFLFGFNEGPDQIMTAIESQWVVPADMHRPMWVFSDGGQVSSLWTPDMTTKKADITTEDLRTRVTGSVPGVNTSYGPYATFRTEWFSSTYSMGGTVSPDTMGPAGAYDIIYMLAYSTIAVGNNPLTGPNLVKYGLRNMVPGANIPKITIGRSHISDPFALLGQGKPIDIEGTSGQLDFDVHGEAKSDIQVWCVPKGTAGNIADAAIYSDLYYDYALDKMAGAINTACGLP
jgi:branched-chain amino acid transport system substrate-binding protein